MITTPIRSFVTVCALTIAAAVASVSAVRAQFVGGNVTGSMVLSPLGENKGRKGPVKTPAQRRAEKVTAERLKRLQSVRRRLASARAAAAAGRTSTSMASKVRHLGAAVRRAESARWRVDRLRRLYSKDKAFMAHADRAAFEVRIELSGFKRELKKLGVLPAATPKVPAARGARAEKGKAKAKTTPPPVRTASRPTRS